MRRSILTCLLLGSALSATSAEDPSVGKVTDDRPASRACLDPLGLPNPTPDVNNMPHAEVALDVSADGRLAVAEKDYRYGPPQDPTYNRRVWNGLYLSADSGATWSNLLFEASDPDTGIAGVTDGTFGQAPGRTIRLSHESDPALAFDAEGSLYTSALAFEPDAPGAPSAIVLSRLDRVGRPVPGTRHLLGLESDAALFNDKNWIAVDPASPTPRPWSSPPGASSRSGRAHPPSREATSRYRPTALRASALRFTFPSLRRMPRTPSSTSPSSARSPDGPQDPLRVLPHLGAARPRAGHAPDQGRHRRPAARRHVGPSAAPRRPLPLELSPGRITGLLAFGASGESVRPEAACDDEYGFIGDYIGLAADERFAYAAWSDMRALVPAPDVCSGDACAGRRNLNVYFARIPRTATGLVRPDRLTAVGLDPTGPPR